MGWKNDLKGLLQKCKVKPKGVLHVGAHLGEEVPYYKDCGFEHIWLVEPLPECAAECRKIPGVVVHNAAITPAPGDYPFWKTAKDTRSSLLLPIGEVTGQSIDDVLMVRGIPLSNLEMSFLNVLVIDAQGSELSVIKSGMLESVDLIIVECRFFPQYEGQAEWPELSSWLGKMGFAQRQRWKGKTGKIQDFAFTRKGAS